MFNLDPYIYHLLSDEGSLTEQFKQMIGSAPNLTRLCQGHQFVCRQEQQMLAIKPRQLTLVREILMGNGDKDWMFARTLVPTRTLKGAARRISYLNEKPIGNILFGRNGAVRKSMQVSLTWELPETLTKRGFVAEHPLWQRRSMFEFSSGPLMVLELFLPDCPIYQMSYL